MVLVCRRLDASRLMPDLRFRDIVAPESLGAGASAPVRLFPISEIVLVEEPDDLQCGARYQHAYSVRVVASGYTVELAGVPHAAADLLCSGRPNANATAGRVDDFRAGIEVGLRAESRAILSGLPSVNKGREKRRVNRGVVVQEKDVVRSLREREADTEVSACSEADIRRALDYMHLVKLITEPCRLAQRGPVIHDDNAPVRVGHVAEALETVPGVLETIPVEDNDGYKRFSVEQDGALRE